MNELLIKLKRLKDGSAALSAVRHDGTATWQRQTGPRGQFFPAHDLTHYAVETALGFTQGFFGLIAEGWEISDFAPPFPRGPIPAEAREVEIIVSLLDNSRRFEAAEFQAQAESYVAARRATGKDADAIRVLTNEELERVRKLRREVLERWEATKVGETLELPFGSPSR